jgi:hypothetical protein
MFLPEFNWIAGFKWILKDYTKRQEGCKKPVFQFAIENTNSFCKVHRSGWYDITQGLSEYAVNQGDILLDLSVDGTFHWTCETLVLLGILPYTKPWYGFVHHTFDTTFSGNTCHELFLNPIFIASLAKCRGLFVFSNHLCRLVKQQLTALGKSHVRVIPLFHPTDIQVPVFDTTRYDSLTTKKILHIGGWLRNSNTFYKLQVPDGIEKVLLKGKYGNVDIPTCSLICQLCPGTSDILPGSLCHPSMCRGEQLNRFDRQVIQDLNEMIESVTVVEDIQDDDYDQLLASSVVFLNLVDASACNTVIECLARHTPIIINRLPALEEYLGKDYPLFYPNGSSQFDINLFVYEAFQMNKIQKASKYLENRPKERIILSEFIDKVVREIK